MLYIELIVVLIVIYCIIFLDFRTVPAVIKLYERHRQNKLRKSVTKRISDMTIEINRDHGDECQCVQCQLEYRESKNPDPFVQKKKPKIDWGKPIEVKAGIHWYKAEFVGKTSDGGFVIYRYGNKQFKGRPVLIVDVNGKYGKTEGSTVHIVRNVPPKPLSCTGFVNLYKEDGKLFFGMTVFNNLESAIKFGTPSKPGVELVDTIVITGREKPK